jgi:cysteine desulfurase
MLRALDDRGFAISTGSACSTHRKGHGSGVLQAMGISPEVAQNAVRFSFGHTTTTEDSAALLSEVRSLWETLGRG